ncbi:MAG: hypothetical protein ABI614_22945 [Planctomycetota bacterium]
MPDDTKSDQHKELDKVTIGELISMLPAKQVWGTVVLLGGLMAGAFALGHKTSSWHSSIEQQQLTGENDQLAKDITRLKVDEIQPLIQDKERLKAKENVQRKFFLYQLAEVKKTAASIGLQHGKLELRNLTEIRQPEPPGRFASDAARDRYEADTASYEAKLNEIYAGLDDHGKRSLDDAKSKLQEAQRAYDEANSEYLTKVGDLSQTIHFYESDERDRLGFALITAVRGIENQATITFLCDDTVFHVWNEILWPTAP